MSKPTTVRGEELMVFLNNKSIAYATSHTLNITGNTIDISSKDHGYFGASEIGNITWEVTSENLFTDGEYDTLFTAMLAKTPVTLVFGRAKNYNANGLGESQDNWSPDDTQSSKYYQGPAVITSLNLTANTGEMATFSVTFTGNGALEQKTVAG